MQDNVRNLTNTRESQAETAAASRNVYQLFKHKKDCTWNTPLATGQGTWGCNCGLDNLLLELEDFELTDLSASPQPKYAKCWMVERDSECDPPEFFATEDEATKNACLGLATTHITPLFTSKPFFAAAPAQEPRTNATIHDKLRPCPFCGCLASMNAHGQVFSGLPGYRVECEGDCHAMTCYWHTEEQALTAWNRRAAQEQPVENSPQLDDSRCAICGWPLAESVEKGCTRGNCSMRPFPEVFYDLERAEREYGKRFGVQAGVPQAEPPKEDVKEVEFIGSWLDMAICVAVKSHAGQLDKSRNPYILHPLRVMAAVAQEGEAAMIAAVLHDAVEDTELSLESVKEQFGDEVASMVDSLSRRKGKETYREFIQRVKLNPMAAKIKIADLHDNLSRIENLAPNEQSIRHRYEKALIELAGAAQPGDDKPGGAE